MSSFQGCQRSLRQPCNNTLSERSWHEQHPQQLENKHSLLNCQLCDESVTNFPACFCNAASHDVSDVNGIQPFWWRMSYDNRALRPRALFLSMLCGPTSTVLHFSIAIACTLGYEQPEFAA